MFLTTHPDINLQGKKFIGYWADPRRSHPSDLPSPQNFVDLNWDAAERLFVAQTLSLGTRFIGWRGFSGCRICGCLNGTTCQTLDGTVVFPEGFAHYVSEHGVRPPQEFVDYLRGLPPELLVELQQHKQILDLLERESEVKETCPNMGSTCQPASQPGRVQCHGAGYSSNTCTRDRDLRYKRLDQEQKRHQQAWLAAGGVGNIGR